MADYTSQHNAPSSFSPPFLFRCVCWGCATWENAILPSFLVVYSFLFACGFLIKKNPPQKNLEFFAFLFVGVFPLSASKGSTA